MDFPQINREHVPSWYGYFTTGPKKGTWQRFHRYTTQAPVIVNGRYVAVEWVSNLPYMVYYKMTVISPVAGRTHYWLHEVSRRIWIRTDGTL